MFGISLSLSAIAASVACALAYSASDSFRKETAHRIPALAALFYAFLMEAPVLIGWITLSGDVRLDAGYIFPGLLDAVIGLGANLFFIVAIRQSPLSLMIPLLALVPVLTAVIAGGLLGEWPSAGQGIGILFVTTGLFSLFMPAEGPRHVLAVWQNIKREPGALPMAGVIVLWSIQPSVDKICLSHASIGLHGFIQLAALVAMTGIWLVTRGGIAALALPRGVARPLLGVAFTAGLGYGLQLAAYQLTLVAVVELIKRTIGLAGALLLGRAYFREPLTGPKIFGVAIMTLGMPLVLLS